MTFQVLQSYSQNLSAREEMRVRGISCWPETLRRTLISRMLRRNVATVGELNKSWDVLETVRFLEEKVSREQPILVFGAYASEVLCSLYLAGLRNLAGIVLNSGVRNMPFSEKIRYVTGNMMSTPFGSESMSAITAISVIEHGLTLHPFFREVARLLAPGGFFIAATDYWPEKIDTAGIPMYGMDWTIFSKIEI